MSYDEEIESTLLVNKQCYVYKIPPRHTSSGFRAAEWDLASPIWTGKLVVVSKGDNCFIRLQDPNNGDLFAVCPLTDTAVEPVSDSSRYFVLRIDDGRGRHAFIGMGFSERAEAFDFSAALQDHRKYVNSRKEAEESAKKAATQPKVDYSLKDGQTIRVEIKTKKPTTTSTTSSSSGGGLLLPPPPGSKQPQQVNTQRTQQPQNQGGLFFQTQPSQPSTSNDLWGDFTSFSGQQQTTSKPQNSFPNDWVAFQ